MSPPAKEEFLHHLDTALADGSLVRAKLGRPTGRDPQVNAVLIRPVTLRGTPHLSFVYRQPTRDLTRNFPTPEGQALVAELLGRDFAVGYLSTTRHTAQLNLNKGRAPRLVLGPPDTTSAPSTDHDRLRPRAIDPGSPWLGDLGITRSEGGIRAGREAKFRQIHRFAELLEHLLAEVAPTDPAAPRLVDMGCGRGYLTFAAWDVLRRRPGCHPIVTGIELRPELAEEAEGIARRHGCEGLGFRSGDIAGAPLERVDIVVALHACDTATDDALARGVAACAPLLLVAPCCHKEVRPQFVPPPVLVPVLHHGIFRERQAEFVTDALRALLLEAAGYRTRVFEFISPEHTGKNLMIAAFREPGPVDTAGRRAAAAALAREYGIHTQRLATHLDIPLTPP